jgi:trigger factor
MQINETSAEGLTRKYQVTIGADEVERTMQRRLKEIAKTVSLPGFRPGKVPVSVVKQRFGQSIMGEVLEQAVNESSAETLKDKNLRPALQPTIEISSFGEGKDLVYDMKVEILPDVALPDLSGISLERLKPELPDSDIDDALKNLADRYRKSETVTDGSALETGDIAVIDFVGSIDGEEFAGGSATDQPLELGSGRFIPGFEEQLTGAKTGDHVTIKVSFPADYGAEHLAGKDASFEVDVKEVKRKLPPMIDDALAEEVGLENLESLRSTIREQMISDYDRLGRQKLKRDLLDKLAETHDFTVPAGMVEIEFNTIWKQFEEERERAKAAGTYQAELADDEEKTKAEYRSIAERRVRLGLLLAEIGKDANIQVTQDEVNRAIMAQARQYRGQEKAIIDFYKGNPDALQALRAPLYEDKVVDHIFEKVTLTDKLLPPKEFIAAAQLDDEETEGGDTDTEQSE